MTDIDLKEISKLVYHNVICVERLKRVYKHLQELKSLWGYPADPIDFAEDTSWVENMNDTIKKLDKIFEDLY